MVNLNILYLEVGSDYFKSISCKILMPNLHLYFVDDLFSSLNSKAFLFETLALSLVLIF